MVEITNGDNDDNLNSNSEMDLERQRQTLLLSATNKLERQRSLHSEFEACILFSSHLLSHPLSDVISLQLNHNKSNQSFKNENTNDADNDESFLSYSNTPGGVIDAHNALVECCLPENIDDSTSNNNFSNSDSNAHIADSIASGQLAQMCKNTALSSALKRAAHLTTLIETAPYDENTPHGPNETKTNETQNKTSATSQDYQTYYNLMQLMKVDQQPEYNNDDSENENDRLDHWFRSFYTRLRDIREYHAKHNTTAKHDLGKDNSSIPLFPVMPSDSEYFDNQKITPVSITPNNIIEKSKKRARQGNPEADGYDLSSIISTKCSKMTEGGIFSGEEVLGKYLDMNVIHAFVIQKGISSVFQAALNEKSNQMGTANPPSETNSSFSYLDFLSILLSGLSSTLPEHIKLKHRKKYMKFLQMTNGYLHQFLLKTSPLLDVKVDIIDPAMKQFDLEWKEHGGIDGWEKKPQERAMINTDGPDTSASNDTKKANPSTNLDLSKYSSPQELEQKVDKDVMKTELSRLGLKCGGTPLDRAKRLFLTKNTPLDQIPKKHFVKKAQKQKQNESDTSDNKNISPTMNSNISNDIANNDFILSAGNERRIDVARLEAIVSALLLQLRPTLDATARRADRRLTQTINEREREIYEEIYGTSMKSSTSTNKKSKTEDDNDGEEEESDNEDEDTPIYNPKGVPLGWDGKPIPYWLFKLHGLNHFFPCEICGNESYRGRRNFEKHFTESKHAYGMRCLGIPNTKHFHGVVKINDALQLWEKIKGGVEGSIFDGDKDEEYEDSHGNVLKRGEYEDLARQGLL